VRVCLEKYIYYFGCNKSTWDNDFAVYQFEVGIGINDDSVVYISAARNLLNGLGLSTHPNFGGHTAPSVEYPTRAETLSPRPITHFPPLYPLLLGSVGILGVDPLVSARYIAALLFGVNIMIVGVIVNRISGSSWLSIIGSLLIFISQPMIGIHIYAWSEPLFIFLGFLGLFFLRAYLITREVTALVYSATAISLAFMSRYVGLSLIITGIIGILSFSGERYKKRIIHCAILELWAVFLWGYGLLETYIWGFLQLIENFISIQ